MLISSLLLLTFVLALAPDEETYTFKIKLPARGDVIKVNHVESTNDSVIITLDGKEKKSEKQKGREEEKYIETILETKRGEIHPTRLKRKYDRAVFTKE